MSRLSTLLLALLSLVACADDDSGDGDPTQGDPQETNEDSEGDETEAGDPVCIPEGFYGLCSVNLCQCVLGGDLYQFCTNSCTDSSECGDPADFPGATPVCSPLNPNEEEMVCSLQCTSDADCPCGLECEPTYLICSEPQ